MSKSFQRLISRSGANKAEIGINLFKKNDLEDLISALQGYRNNIKDNTERFLSDLADIGIRAAEKHTGDYAGYIEFSKELENGSDGVKCILVAKDRQKIISRWRYRGDWKEAEVSPLLMAEFGSGWFAEVLFPVEDGSVGQGTFPGQKHAFDENGWSWTDEEGQHHSYGEYPSHPMFQASIEMMRVVDRFAKGAFF